MSLAFFIWLKLYKKAFPYKWHFLLALFSFSSSYYLSYYAAELKQYSMDVLVVAIFCLYLGHQSQLLDKKPSKTFSLATWILPFTLMFSYISFLIFWVVIYNFLHLIKKNKKIIPLFLAYSSISLLFILLVFLSDLRHSLATRGLFSYWNDYFLCTDSGYCFFKSFGEGLRKLAVWWFGNIDFLKRSASFVIPFFVVSLFGYGFKSIINSRYRLWTIDALGIVIFIELFVLGILKKYPFTGERITLFFAPFVFYFIVKGISSLKKNKILYRFFSISYLVLLLGSSLNSLLSYLNFYK